MPKRTRKTKVLARMQWLTNYKTGKPCQDCGKTYDPICMDFHHEQPELKKDEIRMLLRDGYSMEIVQAEIDKCVLICSNCHRLRHKDDPVTVYKVAQRSQSKAVLPL
jgi:hypothetical protein|tara:strand:+ start:1630 stop:1950 length:321 start_codon:yes stop_codon:yes gene_type:complete